MWERKVAHCHYSTLPGSEAEYFAYQKSTLAKNVGFDLGMPIAVNYQFHRSA
jgi:hypothetical protein